MRKDIDKFKLILVKPDGTEIGYLNHYNLIITNTSSIDRISQISFKLPEYIDTNIGEQVVNPYYGVAKAGYKVLLIINNKEKGEYRRMFRISRPQEFTDGTKTSILYSAYSYETVLNSKSIPSFAGAAVDVDGNSGIVIDVNGNVTYTPIDPIDVVDYVLDGVTIAEVSVSILAQIGSLWEVDYVDPELREILRSDINISGTKGLNALKSLQEIYGAVIVFDTIDKKVKYYKLDNLGEDLGFSVEYGKYLKSLNKDERVDEIITRVKVVGANNVGIESVSYTGQNYIEDYTYFLGSFNRTGPTVNVSSEWMSDSLALAISDYNDLIDTKKSSLDILLVEKDVILSAILTLEINLIYLNIGQDLIEEHLIINDAGLGKITLADGVRIKDNVGGIGLVEALVSGEYIVIPYSTGVPASVVGNTYRANTQVIDGENVPYHGNDELFFDLSEYPVGTNVRVSYRSYGKAEIDDTINAYQAFLSSGNATITETTTLEAIIAVLNISRDTQIALVETDEASLETENNNLVVKDAQIKVIQDLLSIDANFTIAQLEEWENFIVEYTYQNNSISDPELLLIAAQEILDERKYPEVIMTLDMISVLQTEDARVDWDKVNLYDYINIYFDRLGIDIQAKIMEITINVDNNNMGLIISTTKDYIKDSNRLLQKSIKAIADIASNVGTNDVDWNKSAASAETLDNFEDDGMSAEKYNVVGSNDNSVIIDELGMTIVEKVVMDADWNPEINIPSTGSDSKYGDKFVRLANGGIYLTDDGGKTFRTAITAGQVYADVIKGNLLVGNELLITGNDGSNDILEIGNIDTNNDDNDDDFGIMIDGIVNGNDVKVIMARDKGFRISVDTGSGFVDTLIIDTDGSIKATNLNLVGGAILVGSDLLITGNDGSGDTIFIGNMEVYDPTTPISDFGILVKGNDGAIKTELSMGVSTGFNIYTELDPTGAPGELTSVFSSENQINVMTYNFNETMEDRTFGFHIPVSSDSDIISFGLRIAFIGSGGTYDTYINGTQLIQRTAAHTFNILIPVINGDNTIRVNVITGPVNVVITLFGTVSSGFTYDTYL